jgi:hypothetical protein
MSLGHGCAHEPVLPTGNALRHTICDETREHLRVNSLLGRFPRSQRASAAVARETQHQGSGRGLQLTAPRTPNGRIGRGAHLRAARL